MNEQYLILIIIIAIAVIIYIFELLTKLRREKTANIKKQKYLNDIKKSCIELYGKVYSLSVKDMVLQRTYSLDIKALLSQIDEKIEKTKIQNDKKIAYLQNVNNELENNLENLERLKKQDNDFQKVYNLIKKGENVFITGGAGTGKSYILKHLKDFIPELKNNITSTTGVSAINIEGVTINSWAKFKVNFNYNELYLKENIENEIFKQATKSAKYAKKEHKEKIKKTTMLAIDEISMLSDYTFMFLDYYFQIIRGTVAPFGGIQMVIIGDFCQLPPVIKEKNTNDNSRHYAFLSESWKNLNLKYVLLQTFHRQEKDIKFAKCLNDLRLGKNIEFAESYLSECIINDVNIEPNLIQVYQTNKDANNYNLSCLNIISSEKQTLFSDNYFVRPQEKDGQTLYKIETDKLVPLQDYICNGEDRIEKDTKAPNMLTIKIGCKVMVTKNIDVEKGIANGTIGYVCAISETLICVDFANIKNYPLKKEDFIFYDKYRQQYILRRQFPLILAYAITIHKSQGLTFDDGVVVNIKDEKIINSGQAYVALSRVRTKDKLHILKKFPTNKIVVDKDVVNFYLALEKQCQ